MSIDDADNVGPIMGVARFAWTGTKVIDVRAPLHFDEVIIHCLEMAKDPRGFVDRQPHAGSSISEEGERTTRAAELGRSACTTAVVMSVCKLQAEINWCLASVDSRLFGLADLFVTEVKPRLIDALQILLNVCNTKLDLGDALHDDIKTIVQMRNELVHDKPLEPLRGDVSKGVERWHRKLSNRIPDLEWLPSIRQRYKGRSFLIVGECAIQKVMIFPVAAWVWQRTNEITRFLRKMVVTQDTGLRVSDSKVVIHEPRFPSDAAGQ